MAINKLDNELRKRAKVWATNITKIAKSLAPNSHIRRSIKTKTVVRSGLIDFDIKAGVLDEYGGSDARAYEYGSGIHATRKHRSKNQLPDGRILIKPRPGRKALAFPWDIASANPENFKMLDDGRVVLPQVKHPGVAAANNGQGYVRPARREVMKQIRAELGPAVYKTLVGEINLIFKGTNK